MFFIAGAIGGVIGIFIFKTLFEFAIFKRVMNDPAAGKLASVAAAYVLAVICFGLLARNGLGLAAIIYLPGALLWGALGYHSGLRTRAAMSEHVGDVFQ